MFLKIQVPESEPACAVFFNNAAIEHLLFKKTPALSLHTLFSPNVLDVVKRFCKLISSPCQINNHLFSVLMISHGHGKSFEAFLGKLVCIPLFLPDFLPGIKKPLQHCGKQVRLPLRQPSFIPVYHAETCEHYRITSQFPDGRRIYDG